MRLDKLIVVLLFVTSCVFSAGVVVPENYEIDFEPGLEKEFSFVFDLDEMSDLNIEGDLNEFVYLDKKKVEGIEEVTVGLKLPEKLDKFGVNEVRILAGDVKGVIAISVSSSSEFSALELVASDANIGGNVKFVIPVVAEGGFDLNSISANIEIYNKAGVKLDSFVLESKTSPSGVMKLEYDWKADVEIGEYVAKAMVSYGGESVELEDVFGVGSEDLVLQEVRSDGFKLGKVSKIEMLIENMWGVPVGDAFIETKVLGSGGSIVSEFKSLNYDIGALRKEVFISYWDSDGVSKGSYDVEISINYGDKVIRKALSFEVRDDELIVGGIDYVATIGTNGGYNWIVIVLVVVLVVINLLWFFFFKNKFGSFGK
jgi:hypothetical protein